LVLNVVNRHKDDGIDTTIALEDKTFAGAVSITEVNGPDIKSVNDFGRTEVRAQSRSADARGNTAQHRFPPHSFTQLKVQLS
jgi:alpha-N-arabinofuranosidase